MYVRSTEAETENIDLTVRDRYDQQKHTDNIDLTVKERDRYDQQKHR